MKPSSKNYHLVKKLSPNNREAFVLQLSRSPALKKFGIQSSSMRRKRSKLGRVPKTSHKLRSPLKRPVAGDGNELHLLSGKNKSSLSSGKILSELEGKTSGKSSRTHSSPCGKIPTISPTREIHRQHTNSTRKELIEDEQIKCDFSRISKKTEPKVSPKTHKADCVTKKIEPFCFESESCSGFKQYLTDLIDYQCWLAGKMGTLEKELEFALVRHNNSTSDEDPGIVMVGTVSGPKKPLNKKRFFRAAFSQMTSQGTLQDSDKSKAIRVTDEEMPNTQLVHALESCGDIYEKPNHKLGISHHVLSSADHDPQRHNEQTCTSLPPHEIHMRQEDKEKLTKNHIAVTKVRSCKNVTDCIEETPTRCCASAGVSLHYEKSYMENRRKSLIDNVNPMPEDEEQMRRACSTNTEISLHSERYKMKNDKTHVACDNGAPQNVQPTRHSYPYGLQYLLLFIITVLQCFLQFLSPFDTLK